MNPDLPSYECRAYQKLKPKLEFVADMFEGRNAWFSLSSVHSAGRLTDPLKAAKYLPVESEEPEEEYVKRLSRSYFERKFREAIENFSGFLSSFILSDDIASSIKEAIDDIDFKGNSLEVFLRTADEKALRDEHCFILVEFPKNPTDEMGNDLISSALEERAFKLRPYFVLIDSRDVLNWTLAPDNQTLLQVTIREAVSQPKGRYGTEEITRYRVLTPGAYEVFEIEDGGLVQVDAGYTSLDFIPLHPYSLTNNDGNPMSGEPPLYDLAELNLKHYQKCSEKDEAMHKCNMAVLEVQELVPSPRGDDEPQPIVRIGPNTCLWNVSARFVEPSGSAIAATQSDIEKLEMAIERRTLSFLSGTQLQRTATEVATFSAPVQANLAGMARAKQSNVQKCFDTWVRYLTPTSRGGGILVDEKILQAGMDAAAIGSLLGIRTAGELTRKSFLSLLRLGKALPKDFDIDFELEQLDLVEKERIALAQQMALVR